MAQRDWDAYYKIKSKDAPPHPLLRTALSYVPQRERALELGGGTLRDPLFLLRQGFERVDVVDYSEPARERAAEVTDQRIRFHHTTFAAYVYPEAVYDLVSSQFSLPFTPPETFADVWHRINTALKPGGIFAGHLFGCAIHGTHPDHP